MFSHSRTIIVQDMWLPGYVLHCFGSQKTEASVSNIQETF